MLAPGTVLQNRYQIIRLLGQGAMGTTYQARHSGLGGKL
jgi:serine/threonine protein kinase